MRKAKRRVEKRIASREKKKVEDRQRAKQWKVTNGRFTAFLSWRCGAGSRPVS